MKLEQLFGGSGSGKNNSLFENNKILIIAAAAVLSVLAFSKGSKQRAPSGFFGGFGGFGNFKGAGGFNGPPPGYNMGPPQVRKRKHKHHHRHDEYDGHIPGGGYYPYESQQNPGYRGPGLGNPWNANPEFNNPPRQEYGSQSFSNSGFENPESENAYREDHESAGDQ